MPFNYNLDFKTTDFRRNPELYRIGKGEQGVLLVEPYKSEILPFWRFKTPEVAAKSAEQIYNLFLNYLDKNDFVGADMARKFLQMGFTRSRRYANHKSGRENFCKVFFKFNGLPLYLICMKFMSSIPTFLFTAKIWLWQGKGAWHFVTLPADIADKINNDYGYLKQGWGSIPVVASIGKINWETSIFSYKKSRSFLLPIKAKVREKAKIKESDEVSIVLELKYAL